MYIINPKKIDRIDKNRETGKEGDDKIIKKKYNILELYKHEN